LRHCSVPIRMLRHHSRRSRTIDSRNNTLAPTMLA
jgi:hypothetical protein